MIVHGFGTFFCCFGFVLSFALVLLLLLRLPSIQFKVKDSNVILIIIAKHFMSRRTLCLMNMFHGLFHQGRIIKCQNQRIFHSILITGKSITIKRNVCVRFSKSEHSKNWPKRLFFDHFPELNRQIPDYYLDSTNIYCQITRFLFIRGSFNQRLSVRSHH